jgi:hypothetical protein
MIVNDRKDERNYELNGSRKEHNDKKHAQPPSPKIDLVGFYKALTGVKPWWEPDEKDKKPSEK